MMRGQFVPHVPQRLQGAGEVHRRAGSIMHRWCLSVTGDALDAHHLWTPERRSCRRRFQQLANAGVGFWAKA